SLIPPLVRNHAYVSSEWAEMIERCAVQVGRTNRAVVSALVSELGEENPLGRQYLAKVLADIGSPQAVPALEILDQLAHGPDRQIAYEAARGLWTIADQSEPFLFF